MPTKLSAEEQFRRHIDFALAFMSMQYRAMHPEDKTFVTPSSVDMIHYLSSLGKDLQFKQIISSASAVALYKELTAVSPSVGGVRRRTTRQRSRGRRRTTRRRKRIQRGGNIFESIRRLAFMVVGGDGAEYGVCGKIFQGLALAFTGIMISVICGLVLTQMVGGASFSESITSMLSSPLYNNGIHDPVRFAVDCIDSRLLPMYDSLLLGLSDMATNAASQLVGNEECMAALAGVSVTSIGATVGTIANSMFNGYLYYKFIVVPGSAVLHTSGIDCDSYLNAQRQSYGTGARIFIFEGLPAKVMEIITHGDDCQEFMNPFGIGAASGDC
jgi:hypothetical protein